MCDFYLKLDYHLQNKQFIFTQNEKMMHNIGQFLSKNRKIDRYQMAKLHTFEVCARHLSFAMAAEELCITASAVSHQINKLEEELGFLLFKRFHRRIELTYDGEKLFHTLQRSFDLLIDILPYLKSGDSY